MRIILDFDYTQFNTDLLKEEVMKMFGEHGVSQELFWQTFEESKDEARNWNPSRQLEILKDRGMRDIVKIRRKFRRMLQRGHLFLFEDTMPFLRKAKGEHALFVLSHGEDAFQKEKIQGCGRRYRACFKKIVVTRNIDKDIEAGELAEGEEAMFVDDNPAALRAVKKYAPQILTVRMNRGLGRYAKLPTGEGTDYEAKNFEEVLKLKLI